MRLIDFYILSATTSNERQTFACRLCDRAFRQHTPVCLLLADSHQAQYFDQLLWAWRPASFIPHDCWTPHTDKPRMDSPVIVTCAESLADVQHSWANAGASLLINLQDNIPQHYQSFGRLAEIVVQEPDILALSRSAWREYKALGCELRRHDLRQG